MRVMLVAGARPNFMKIAPLLATLESRGADAALVHTGQHYDGLMSGVFLDELGIRAPDYYLGAGSGSHAEQTAAVMRAFEPLVAEDRPDHVVVVGDVNSTAACALVGAKAGAVVSHVEAGLRSRDWTMPEEINRVVTDRVSDLLFAPSADAAENLRLEGYRQDQIHLVGNIMIDTLLLSVERALKRPIVRDLGLERGSYGLATLHRPANVDDVETLNQIMAALALVAERVPLVLPAHPRAASRLQSLNRSPRIDVIDSLGYLDFLALEAQAALVLTDSGGVQEETTVLGVPCLTLRENTERPITVTEGTNCVVGRDPQAIVAAADRALNGQFQKRRPALWDGKAADRIADVLLTVDRRLMPSPTALHPAASKTSIEGASSGSRGVSHEGAPV